MIRQQDNERTLSMLHWGLVPHWAKDKKIGYKMINARAETVASKPSFREPFHSHRCIIPASGFFEWKKAEKAKLPYYIFRKDGAPMALAGLWDRWVNPGNPGEVLESCTIITTESNDLVAQLHNRMPAILEQADIDAWFSPHQHYERFARPAAAGSRGSSGSLPSFRVCEQARQMRGRSVLNGSTKGANSGPSSGTSGNGEGIWKTDWDSLPRLSRLVGRGDRKPSRRWQPGRPAKRPSGC